MTGKAVVFHDGLGERRHTINAGALLDLLVLRHDLGVAPGFETALRQRIDRLATFQHPSYARVRGVGRISSPQSRLVVAANHTPGSRLSDVLAVAERQLIPLAFTAAAGALRQILHALAALHETAPHASHGALAPERVVLTPDGRLVIVEHVLGAALEQLQWTPERYWQELRIAVPSLERAPSLDQRADVLQAGALALALLLGRPLGEHDHPGRMAELVETAGAVPGHGLDALRASLRSWLARALQLDPRRAFASAIEARVEFDATIPLDERAGRDALAALLLQYDSAARASEPPRAVPPDTSPRTVEILNGTLPALSQEPADATHLSEPPRALSDTSATRVAEILKLAAQPQDDAEEDDEAAPEPPRVFASIAPRPPIGSDASEPGQSVFARRDDPPPAAAALAPADAGVTPDPEMNRSALLRERDPEPRAPVSIVRRIRSWRVAAAAAVLVAMATAGVFVSGGQARVPATGTLVVQTTPSGAQVTIDGELRGVTPLTLELASGEHVLELSADGRVRSLPVTIAEGAQMTQVVELPPIAPAAGRLHVRTEPAGAEVAIDGVVRGESPLEIEGLEPGPHTVVLRNALGSVTEQVTIEPGATAALVVPLTAPAGAPVSGWIAVTAPVEIQVYEQGRLLGSSRSERIMVAAGAHDLELRNDALAYQTRRAVQVSPGRTTPIRIDVPSGTLALNATPWAEVWLDGQRLGETPIGNVQVPIGTHDVVFRHPELGERRQTVQVTLAGPVRVSTDFRKP